MEKLKFVWHIDHKSWLQLTSAGWPCTIYLYFMEHPNIGSVMVPVCHHLVICDDGVVVLLPEPLPRPLPGSPVQGQASPVQAPQQVHGGGHPRQGGGQGRPRWTRWWGD